MSDLFASYCWGPVDAEGARPLQRKAHAVVARLRAAGFSVWLDADHMAHDASGGSSGTAEARAKAILGASAVVCLISAEYARSDNCKLEAQYAKKKSKPLYYVNVGAPGYDPGKIEGEDASKVSWLDVQVLNDLWFDCRLDDCMPSEIDKLVGVLKANPAVSFSGGEAAAQPKALALAQALAEAAQAKARLEAQELETARLKALAHAQAEAQERALAEATAGRWVDVCNEGDVVSVRKGTLVRYGTGSTWVEGKSDGHLFRVSNEEFGRDPSPGIVKRLQLWAQGSAGAEVYIEQRTNVPSAQDKIAAVFGMLRL